jgi:DNA repair exonuclease SbcCD ATPase subunit
LSFRQIFNAVEEKSNVGVTQSWKQFSAGDCIVTVKEALKELKQASVNAGWKKIWPEAVKNSTKIPSADQDILDIVNIAHCIEGEGLSDMVPGEVQEPNYKITHDDLDELIQSSTDLEENEEEEETNVNQWTLEYFADLFKDFRNLKHKIRELDRSMKRSMKTAQELEQAFAPYTMLYNGMTQKKKPLPITLLFVKKRNISPLC